jgi:hypothetical protein
VRQREIALIEHGLMLDWNSLNELSRKFADRVFRELGEWEQYAEVLPDEGGTQSSELEITVPQPCSERVLHISTREGEISDAEAIEDALATIHRIIAEQNVVKVVYRDGKWAASSLEEVSNAVAPEAGATTTLYSWCGTYDRTL